MTQTISSGHVAVAAFKAAGEWNTYVRLADIRAQLGGVEPTAYAPAARALQVAGDAVVYPIDAPQRRTREDDAAQIQVCGERRDLVCVKAPTVTTLRRWVREAETAGWGAEDPLLDVLCRHLAAFEEC
jgi:hypothetical protein